MLEWKVEDMKIMNTAISYDTPHGRTYIFSPITEGMTKEEKIEFIDKYTDSKLSFIISLCNKFKEEKSKLKFDDLGYVKTTSLIGWLKRNDRKDNPVVDRTYRYGEINILGTTRYLNSSKDPLTTKSSYDKYDDLVDECMYRLLKDLFRKEEQYYKSIDPYEVAKKKVRGFSEKYRTTFGVHLAFSSDDTITVNPDEKTWKGPQITLEQCNYLISKYEELEKKILEIQETVSVEFKNI